MQTTLESIPLERAPSESSFNVLSERSANDINISLSRLPSKMSRGIEKQRQESNKRSVSASTNGSVIYNKAQRQHSPRRDQSETPEWKRRLVHGDIPYGEQRDLFCSAAEGLQDMFKPPTVNGVNSQTRLEDHNESTMPSSPPQLGRYNLEADLNDFVDFEEGEIFPEQITPSPSPRRPQRELKFKTNISDIPGMEHNLSAARPSGPEHQDSSYLAGLTAGENPGRKTSAQSCISNETFSMILVGKQSGADGAVQFAPIGVPAHHLRQKLEHLQREQAVLGSQYSQHTVSNEGGAHIAENTEDYIKGGGFVNTQRGDRISSGSFKHGVLSPTFGADSSEMLPEESLQASTPKHFPTIRTDMMGCFPSLRSPSLPRAPFPSPEKRCLQESPSKVNGGSPLKLFGPYDTFTNQTLLRRISQLEEDRSSSASKPSKGNSPAEALPYQTNEVSLEEMSLGTHQESQSKYLPTKSRSIHRFGSGELEGFEFSENSSRVSSHSKDVNQTSSYDKTPSPKVSGNRVLGEDILEHRGKRRTSKSPASEHIGELSAASNMGEYLEASNNAFETVVNATPSRGSGSEAKRPRTSPLKDSTPKRRRTLHRSDIAYAREQLNEEDFAAERLQYMADKRNDTLNEGFQLASQGVLAARSILRPHSPSPGQREGRRPSSSNLPAAAKPIYANSKLKHVYLTSAPEGNAGPSKDTSEETNRKPSIRTEDFVDQAAQIMAMIRSQVKPVGLSSLEEPEVDNGGISSGPLDDSYQSSTKEPFSRPPSREGHTLSKYAVQQDDPELVRKLAKYQELSDMGGVISSSIRSVSLAKDAIRAAEELERKIHLGCSTRPEVPLNADGEVESDIPNVRISTNPAQHGRMRSPPRDFPSNSSGATNGSYPTGSSRGSDSRKVIMPESVSHLIPEKVGSMCLDKMKNVWIKKKDETTHATSNPPPSDDSEDDPFAQIPDLTVDLNQEMQNLKLTTARKETSPRAEAENSRSSSNDERERGFVTLSPHEEIGPSNAPLTKQEFDKLLRRRDSDANASRHAIDGPASGKGEEDGGRSAPGRRRNLTISFSSPLASIIRDVSPDDLNSLEDDEGSQEDLKCLENSRKDLNSPAMAGNLAPGSSTDGSANYGKRNVSMRHRLGSGFVPRPVSRIDEQDEDSTVELPPEEERQLSVFGETSMISLKASDASQAGLNFFINHTPAGHAFAMHRRADDSAVIGHTVGKLSLSPLSEFTINKSDPPFGFEVSYVKDHRYMTTGDGSRRVMSMTIRELVDKLSEVEPFEPYWEDITDLDLHGKRLSSLHMLSEFCGKVVTLDASQNGLGHLDGIPSSVRQLKVSQNMLTELTSWDHLMNLQYLDISNNEIKSMSALKHLVHLRSIKADNNQLTSLEELDCHDGLLSLRARNNLINSLDFADVQLQRLTELDVEDNRIEAVRNLELLPALTRLKLSKNKLQHLAVKQSMKGLRHLDVSDNRFESLDIGCWTHLRTLHADRNCIKQICGFSRAHRLDSLSLREQRGESIDLSFLSTAYEIRKLFLSGNRLHSFEPGVDFLSLQMLELASCGLTRLPQKLGQLMPNLRSINLNFNAISDLSPLRFIPRLKRLVVAGNRLTDSMSVTEVITDFPHLTQLDLRDNPMTLGLYAPLQVLVAADRTKYVDTFVLPDAEVERDESYSSRLDATTKLRRRLHQIVLVGSCKRLKKLDGLAIVREDVLTEDGLYQTLVREGLLPAPPDGLDQGPDLAGKAGRPASEFWLHGQGRRRLDDAADIGLEG